MELTQRDLLAKTLQAEAGNQGYNGMVAVGSVIMNRLAGGSDLGKVILQPGHFSAWNSTTGYAGGEQGQDMDFTPSARAYEVADALLSGNYEDPTGGATHYYNPQISDPTWGQSGGGDWQTIGQHVFGKANMAGPKPIPNNGTMTESLEAKIFGGASAMDGQSTGRNMQQPSAIQMQKMQQQQGSGGLMGFLRDPRTREAFASMDVSGRLGGIQQRAAADITKQDELNTANRTAQWLASQPGGQKYADAIAAGVPAADAYRAYRDTLDGPNVGSQKTYLNGTIVQSTSTGRRVIDPTGKVVTGADAQRVIDEANKYDASQAQLIAGSKKIGAVTADQAATAFEKANAVTDSIGSIDSAIAAIDDGAISGFVANYLPNITKASAELRSAMNQMGLDVISSVTFGALSQAEMEVAMSTAVPQNLAAPELRQWLTEKRDKQIKARAALEKAAAYLSQPGNTIASWLEIKAGERDSNNENPYSGKTLEELNSIFNNRGQLSSTQLQQLMDALRAKQG
jgi:hypothetical protein